MNRKNFLLALLGVSFTSHAIAINCESLAPWNATIAYHGGAEVQHEDIAYQANYWTRNNNPAMHSGDYQEWSNLGDCDGVVVEPPLEKPVVSLVDPIAGEYEVGTQLTLSANATDSDGTITEVVFQIDGITVGQINQAPYSTVWTVTEGQHVVKARAQDNDQQYAEATVTVFGKAGSSENKDPLVSLTSPTANATIAVGDDVTLSATASDSDGTIAQVEFFVEGVSVAVDTSAPYNELWRTTTAGSFQVSVIATDDLGATSIVDKVDVVVGNDVPLPTSCRPEGLYQTDAVSVPYCSVYDVAGRERLGDHHNRRIIGYFTSWRNGSNGQPSYLAHEIPWEKLTHINYAFAHIDDQNRISVGDVNDAKNPATGMTWPNVVGAEMDPEFSYQGHFNLLNKYKKQYSHVKTLVSVGGWAETGGFFSDTGSRVDSGGFYSMTTNGDGSVNTAGIQTFAQSTVEFLRTYGFDGVDIDYEYPTSMTGAGNPDDYWIADRQRANLWRSYQVLMKTLREELDKASAADGKHYLLTIASPSSAYLLRGMEDFDVTPYLDFVNIMSYDLHGAWNAYVGHNAALYDTGADLELEEGNVYGTAQYGKIGYLNTDWAVHYFRGALPAGRLNIGVPYYTRGWQNVVGGTNGLWGKAALPTQANCPPGTGINVPCGYGALGINNLWHDKDKNGVEVGAGSNPMWHAKNLEQGIAGSYLSAYGFPEDQSLTGTYSRHYDSVAQSPWLWNAASNVFISTEDDQSMAAKVQYVVDQELGGIMFWELAGDYSWYPERNAGKGEFFIGDTLTTLAFNAFSSASPYGIVTAGNIEQPTEVIELRFDLDSFKVGDNNYPLNPILRLTNTGSYDIPGGAVIEFNLPTSTSNIISDQSGMNLKVIANGSNSAGNNVGGLEKSFHRVQLTLPAWQKISVGSEVEITLNYYLPVPRPNGLEIVIGAQRYGTLQEYPQLPIADIDSAGGGDSGNCSSTGLPVYPNWPQNDWAGNPSHANAGDKMVHNNAVWSALWYTRSEPGSDTSWELSCQL